MAIDLKSILGQQSSSILSPREILELGLRRKESRQKRQELEARRAEREEQRIYDRSMDQKRLDLTQDRIEETNRNRESRDTASLLSAIQSSIPTINDRKDIKTIGNMFRIIDQESESFTPSLEASYTLAYNQYQDKVSEGAQYGALVNNFEKLNSSFDSLLDSKQTVTYDNYFRAKRQLDNIVNELKSDEFDSFKDPSFINMVNEKVNEFNLIGSSLIGNGKLTAEQFELFSKGDPEKYKFEKDNQIRLLTQSMDESNTLIKGYKESILDIEKSIRDGIKEVGTVFDSKELDEEKATIENLIIIEQQKFNNNNENYKAWSGSLYKNLKGVGTFDELSDDEENTEGTEDKNEDVIVNKKEENLENTEQNVKDDSKNVTQDLYSKAFITNNEGKTVVNPNLDIKKEDLRAFKILQSDIEGLESELKNTISKLGSKEDINKNIELLKSNREKFRDKTGRLKNVQGKRFLDQKIKENERKLKQINNIEDSISRTKNKLSQKRFSKYLS